MRALTLLFLVVSAPALAWDGNLMWNAPTTGPTSGGAGIWGTGGRADHHIGCTACHVEAQGQVSLQLTFNPALDTTGGGTSYKPGQRYQVTAALLGEWKGRGFQTCGQYVSHTNGFGAAFELSGGARAGRIETDSGQDSDACPSTVGDPNSGNTTITYGDCHAVAANAKEDLTQWTFWWTAPAAGSGPVTIFWGVVDGDCDMKSTGDDAKVGQQVLTEGVASRDRFPRWPLFFALGLVGIAPAAWRKKRASRRSTTPL